MLFRDKYLLKQLFGFFVILLISVSLILLLTQIFWAFEDAKRAGFFPWKDYIRDFHRNIQILFPFLTLLSAFFVFSEMEKFKQLSILELKGISQLEIFRTFVIFGFLVSIFAFAFGCLPVSIGNNKNEEKNISITTPVVFLWAEQTDINNIFANVLIRIQEENSQKTIQAKKAEFLSNGIIFYDATFVELNKNYFDKMFLKTPFDPLLLVNHLTCSIEQESFIRLRKKLKNMALVGIISRPDWIILYSKLAYPTLNIIIVFLLLPFLYQKRVLSRVKTFITGFILMFFTYLLYAAGLSFGKAEIIPWQVSPWIAHIFLMLFSVIYLSSTKKKVYNLCRFNKQ